MNNSAIGTFFLAKKLRHLLDFYGTTILAVLMLPLVHWVVPAALVCLSFLALYEFYLDSILEKKAHNALLLVLQMQAQQEENKDEDL